MVIERAFLKKELAVASVRVERLTTQDMVHMDVLDDVRLDFAFHKTASQQGGC